MTGKTLKQAQSFGRKHLYNPALLRRIVSEIPSYYGGMGFQGANKKQFIQAVRRHYNLARGPRAASARYIPRRAIKNAWLGR